MIVDGGLMKMNEVVFVPYMFAGVILVANGLDRSYFSLLEQYERTGTFRLGAIFIGGVLMAFTGAIILYTASKWQFKTIIQKVHFDRTSDFSHSESEVVINQLLNKEEEVPDKFIN